MLYQCMILTALILVVIWLKTITMIDKPYHVR